MKSLYLFRHGQAEQTGLSDLTNLGHTQSRLLASHLSYQNVAFDRLYSGALLRQIRTGEAFGRQPIVDSTWDEIDMAALYLELAPPLCNQDEHFRANYQKLAANPRDLEIVAWCHTAIAKAWMEGRYPFSGVSWLAYRDRILAWLTRIGADTQDERIGVFTSITPIAICVVKALQLDKAMIFRVARGLNNAGFTVVDLSADGPKLRSLNEVSHLAESSMRTVL
jgi:broad specificity phosphatase PhoE